MRQRILGGPNVSDPSVIAEQIDTVRTEFVRPELSIVVPTRNEQGNIEPLFRRLDRALGPVNAEIVFADDSSDQTPSRVRSLPSHPGRTVRLLHRSDKERWGGLGGAVVDGLKLATADWVCVMDADLQHPPDLVPALLV